MGHDPRLLQKCAYLLSSDYPEEKFFYVFEKGVPHTRCIPDILVIDRDTFFILCVVEVGYTRPEKLSKYVEKGIPDVRWYSKKLELHSQARNGKKRGLPIAGKLGPNKAYGENIVIDVLTQKLMGKPPHLLMLGGPCVLCELLLAEGKYNEFDVSKDEEQPGTIWLEEYGEYLYFNDKGYTLFTECDNFPEEHDDVAEYLWEDDEGPYWDQKKWAFKSCRKFWEAQVTSEMLIKYYKKIESHQRNL